MSARQRRRKQNRRHRADAGRRRRLAAGAGVAVGTSLLVGNGAAAAATFTVDSLADPSDTGHTTLRDALTSAETSGNSGSTIVFASGLSGTIHLGSQLPDITYPTTIQGPGAGQIAISGDDAVPLFYTHGAADGIDVSISGLSLTNGLSQSPPTRWNGGAIFNQNADLTVSNAVLSGNTALGNSTHDGYGGAICTCTGYGSLTVVNSTFHDNTAGGSGGAIYSDNAPLTIKGSTFDSNQAYYRGGAISDCCAAADSTIENSTVTGNSVIGDQTSVPHAGYGGGVFTYASTLLTIRASTVAGNDAAISGGGVRVDSTATPVTMQNTILANNTTGDTGPDIYGQVNSAFSLIGDESDATITETVPGSDITGQDPQLVPLADNGGLTETMLPATSSPVINKGSAFGLSSDQRAFCRPIMFSGVPISSAPGADGSDMGAVELQNAGAPCPAPPPAGGGATPAPVQPTPTHKKKCKKKKHKRSAESAKKKKCKKKKKKK
jgi:predicted outer membrane repeat protein